uniref:phage tail protein n=1 Tax=uncultured Bilophila sp. TaxID=529385 RepID=UPI00259A57AC
MALSDIQRVFADILDSIWGKDAQTSIPTQPVSGIAYRDTAAEFETGQKYDSLGESSRWNQLLYLLTGLTSELANFGILPWSAAQPYSKGALCIGSDGTLWQAQIDIAASPTNPVPPGTDDNIWSRPKISGFVPDSIRVIAGTGMTGGGPLSADVTLAAKLTDSVSSTDSTTAASATAVKTAYDAAQAKLPLGGGVMTGSIQINDPANVIGSAPSTNTERGMFLGDKNSVIMGGVDVIQHASDNAKR